MLRFIIKVGIKFYQHVISPRKGFRCAHDALHNKGGCSSRILDHIQTKPISQWPSLVSSEFSDCKAAYETIKQRKEKDCKRCSGSKKCGVDEALDCADCSFDIDIGSC